MAVVLPPREGFSPGASGAVGLQVHRLARASRRFAVEVVGSAVDGEPFADVAYRAVEPGWWPMRRTARYAAAVARLLRPAPPALIEVHNRPEVALDLAGAFPEIPVSLFLHNDPQGMRRAGDGQARAALMRRLAGVVVVSAFLRERFLAGLVEGPVRVMPNCLDLSEVPAGLPAEARERRVLFVGRVVADKGADSFVAAWEAVRADLPGWEAEMIGADRFRADSPETPFLRALRPRAAAAGVRMAGYLPHAAVLAAMSRAAIVVVPSRWEEPFGLTALEAMACGAALVCAKRGGLPEVAGDCAVWIDPDLPGEIAVAVRGLAARLDGRAALSRAGLARARLFDVSVGIDALDGFRRSLGHSHV